MSADRWQLLNELFQATTELPPDKRGVFLDAACAHDPALRAEIERLVAAHERAGTFIETPAIMTGSIWSGANRHPAVGREFGHYRILKEIAEGGMGAVYLAERSDGQYEQRVALKLVPHHLVSESMLRRFRAERQILASLEHTNIARLLDGGTSDDGHPYIVMEYIEGVPITQYARSHGLDVSERLALFLQVCQAVAYAHSRRVIHRDIKPINILVTAAGAPKLLDFGIAKMLEKSLNDASAGATGFHLMTPDYASPEQVAGQSASEASDVYSLGVVLYELLTGRSPYGERGRDPLQVADAVVSIAPKRPSDVASDRAVGRELRGDLDTIVLTALRKEPDRRYHGVAQLADDLARFLDNRPIQARPDTRRYRAIKFVRRNRTAVAAGTAGVLSTILLAVVAISFGVRTQRDGHGAATGALVNAAPVIAVGEIIDSARSQEARVSGAIGDMLATNLARVPTLRVVSSARMYEIMALLGSRGDRKESWALAGTRAGAQELLEGTLHQTGSGMRLTLKRVALGTGEVRASYAVAGSNEFDLIERATAEISADLGSAPHSLRVQDATTSSMVAYRFYEEGLRSYAIADYRAAQRLFTAAVAEDPSFAMALHYMQLTRVALHEQIPPADQQALLRLADRATDRERLLIRGTYSQNYDLRALAAVAETLALRYPTEPDGHYLLGVSSVARGDFLSAIPHWQRVVQMDSLGLSGTLARCRACDALHEIGNAYLAADSAQAAERVARNWLRQQPQSTRALFMMAGSLEAQERNVEALAFHRRGATINPGHPFDAVYPALFRIRIGEFRDADALLRELVRDGTADAAIEGLWFLTISLRHQGRFQEALATANRLVLRSRGAGTAAEQLRAQVLLEMGQATRAAAVFDSIAHMDLGNLAPAQIARHRSWNLTHHATALAAAGDTAELGTLADSIKVWGDRSVFGRDWRLHHYVRGLLLRARGQLRPAEHEFRRAIYSPTHGYTRVNLELGRVLMAQAQPRAAVTVLQAALRGSLEGSNLYVTRTELQEALGYAWEAAGQPDSAAVQYRRVLDAWSSADRQLHPRRARVLARLSAL